MKLTELFSATGEPFVYYPGFVARFGISVNSTVLHGANDGKAATGGGWFD